MHRHLLSYLLFLIQSLWLILLIMGNVRRPFFLLACFFLLNLIVIKNPDRIDQLIWFSLSLLVSLLFVVFWWQWWIALMVWHIWIFFVYSMIWWYFGNTVNVWPLSLTVRASWWMTLSFVSILLSFLTLHYSIQDIYCDDLTQLVEQNSPSIDQRLWDNQSTFPTLDLSESAPTWQLLANNYLAQIGETWEQKKTIDSKICTLFVESIHSFANQTWVQVTSLVLLFALLYTLSYIPLFFLSYLFAWVLYLLISLWMIKKSEREITKKILS